MVKEKDRDRKVVVFNKETEAKYLEHLKDKKFSTYVKELIRRDMEHREQMSQNVTLNINDVLALLNSQKVVTGVVPKEVVEDEPKISNKKKDAMKNMLNRKGKR